MTLSYHGFLEKIIELYGAGLFEEALNYINENRDQVNGIDSQIDNFAFCIAALSGNAELSLDIFEKAIQEKGYWYETNQLENDKDLDLIRKNMKFKALLEMNRRREHEFLGLGQSTYHIRDGNHEKGYIILHGNHENARITKGAWSEKSVDHALCVFLQSSQPDFYDAYHWNDREKAIAESSEIIMRVQKEFKDVKEWVLVGFSMSATVVLDLVCRKIVSPDHLILFGPWLPYLEEEKEKLMDLKPNMELSIFIGDQDSTCMEHAQLLKDVLLSQNFTPNYVEMKNTGHGFPVEIDKYLKIQD